MEAKYWLQEVGLGEVFERFRNEVNAAREVPPDVTSGRAPSSCTNLGWENLNSGRICQKRVFSRSYSSEKHPGTNGPLFVKPGLPDRFKGPLDGAKLINVRFCLGTHALKKVSVRRLPDEEQDTEYMFGCGADEDVCQFLLDCKGIKHSGRSS
jgi:hypothetical protein